MKRQHIADIVPAGLVLVLAVMACNIPGLASPQQAAGPTGTEPDAPPAAASAEAAPSLTAVPTVQHVTTPGEPGSGRTVYDVESQSTAPERRAPYGDSYDINRLERPFTQDMIYVPNLDIYSYKVSSDATWWYVQIELMGNNANDPLQINYGVELDRDHDGFGDLLALAHPPYQPTWDTSAVQLFEDTNHNTGGLSGEKSDAPIETDGYDALRFSGGVGDSDPDMAWARAGGNGIQFAFKKSWSGVVFMLGVFADAGLKDPKQLDYVDRFTEPQAGSPVKDKQYYPLGDLYLVDNVCREAFGFDPSGFEPQLCPRDEPAPQPRKTPTCVEPPNGCPRDYYWSPETCECVLFI
jgi:hypothetical protein